MYNLTDINTRDLGSFGEETDEITNLHQILEEVLLTTREDDVAGIARRRRDPFGNGVRDLMAASGRGRLNKDLESSTKPAFVCIVVDTSRETRVRRKDTIGMTSKAIKELINQQVAKAFAAYEANYADEVAVESQSQNGDDDDNRNGRGNKDGNGGGNGNRNRGGNGNGNLNRNDRDTSRETRVRRKDTIG
nr:hypothetical protein [Tanacetum cinerariifolium]